MAISLLAMQTQERRQQGANGTVESQKTSSFPDGSGNWQVNETRHSTSKQDGKNTTTEERVSRLDPNGKLSEVSRTVSRESETARGEKHNTTETYSVDVPGSARDGSLHRSSAQPRPNTNHPQASRLLNVRSSSPTLAIRKQASE